MKRISTTLLLLKHVSAMIRSPLCPQDPGDGFESPTPGWQEIQWRNINNLTNVLVNNSLFMDDPIETGGGFGLRLAPRLNSLWLYYETSTRAMAFL